MEPKYPSEAYRGFRARLPDWLIGIPYARSLEHAVRLLELRRYLDEDGSTQPSWSKQRRVSEQRRLDKPPFFRKERSGRHHWQPMTMLWPRKRQK
jgi:hypothetical protein